MHSFSVETVLDHWSEYPCKLAAEGDRGGGLLIPAREPDDSGIDSDDAVRRLILAHQRLPFSDESSSDDELQIPSPTTNRHRNERRASLKTEEDHDLVIMQWPQDQFTKDQNVTGETSPDRSSPPLYEVELTASDEDDDASVLELVIPMHSSRYQRVPTSSPKKTKPKVVKSDESSSDDELQIPSPTTNRHRNERRASLKTEEDHDLVIMQWPQDQFTKDQNVTGETSPDRSSPPLYEVELTASDEDDDASVLELVIPMHSSRYQRVPTSSPKKTKPKVVKRYFCSMICCGRK
uniref:Uncharacterized protein n=1 Tax=Heliothis virescens TaxID=7102 RepID=A0A2A4JBZ7_HELVI